MGTEGYWGFSAREREEFSHAFYRIAEQLPTMFKSFWCRWEEIRADVPQLVVYDSQGMISLQITKTNAACFRVQGPTRRGAEAYARTARTISDAIDACGLSQSSLFRGRGTGAAPTCTR